MLSTLLLSTVLLAPAQAFPSNPGGPVPRAPEWTLAPQLERGQEWLYRGTFTEESTTGTVQYQRTYRVESRMLVMEASPRGADVACMTILRAKEAALTPNRPGAIRDDTEGRNFRVERFRVDPQGRLSAAPGVELTPPLDGPATLEIGAFVEFPRGRITVEHSWEPRPATETQSAFRWMATGSELVQGTRCAVLKGVLQSADWEQPRADRKSWRRTDTVWVAPRTGMAVKVERVIEVRDPAHREPTYRSVFRGDLESTLPCPGQVFLDRQADIMQAITLREATTPLFATPNRFTSQLNTLLKKITTHLDQTPPTPYRLAIQQVKTQVEAALRGEVQVAPTVSAKTTGLKLGEPAPEFATTDITGKQSVSLKSMRGKPIVLAFYNPSSTFAPEMLRFLAEAAEVHQGKAWILALSVVDDNALVQKQLADLNLKVSILQGNGLRVSYEVDSTPRLILLDGEGRVRGSYLGWGRDTPREVLNDLKPWLGK